MEHWKRSDDVPIASSTDTDLWLASGTLWTKVKAQHELALELGALKPFATTYDWIEDGGVRFLVRVLTNLKRKENAKKQQKRKENFNPFLPYEKDLFVANLSPTHLVLLNKFNVMNYHILMVTRKFESQEDLLTAADFQALAITLSEMDGLAFYNGGKIAGSSQPHKHLQLVPLPLVPDGPRLPIEPPMLAADATAIPYRQASAPLDALDFTQPLKIASVLRDIYQQLMERLALWPGHGVQPLGAYNLLATRQWMCIVPRSQEEFSGISINSLGFAGALLVKNAAQLTKLNEIGPMTVLTEVGLPRLQK
jgi:sulfate adenylyltransferase (ADP) / ATP adenylyltransferase